MNLEHELRTTIAEVPDFPKPGISFKDITPVLLKPELCAALLDSWASRAQKWGAEYIAGIDARGFILGMALAQKLGVGFIPVRKAGKLPRDVWETSYQLEYGEARLAVHRQDIPAGGKVLLHDDLLATGGTARAAKETLERGGAQVVGCLFAMELDFLKGYQQLESTPLHTEVHYSL